MRTSAKKAPQPANGLDCGLSESLYCYMRLRDHPLMSYRNIRNWPPIWAHTSGLRDKKRDGEIGILSEVILSQVDPYSRCYLLVEFEGESYMGTLKFEDATFCRQIYGVLQHCAGKSIRRIGGSYVGHLF
jgi:hypothetical protein